MDLAACVAKSVNIEGTLECFYVYEAPQLTFASFQLLIESFPGLQRFGNLTRWAVNCEGIQQVHTNKMILLAKYEIFRLLIARI